MPFNGSGSFGPFTPGNPVLTGSVISSAAFNATQTDLAAGLTNTITRDGQSPPTANLPMGGRKLTGLADGVVSGDSLRFEQVFGGAVLPIVNGGTGGATAAAAKTALGATAIGDALFIAVNAAAARTVLSVAPRATRIDVASVAGTVNLTTAAPDTDDIRLTGALAITAFTVAVGRVCRFVASDASTLANNANIVTQTGALLALSAGDTFMLRATAANVVEVLGFVAASKAGQVIQQLMFTDNGGTTTAVVLTNITNSVKTITPRSTNSTIVVQCVSNIIVPAGGAGTNTSLAGQLFNNTTSANIGIERVLSVASGAGSNLQVTAPMVAIASITNTALTAITFLFRIRNNATAVTLTSVDHVWTLTEIQN